MSPQGSLQNRNTTTRSPREATRRRGAELSNAGCNARTKRNSRKGGSPTIALGVADRVLDPARTTAARYKWAKNDSAIAVEVAGRRDRQGCLLTFRRGTARNCACRCRHTLSTGRERVRTKPQFKHSRRLRARWSYRRSARVERRSAATTTTQQESESIAMCVLAEQSNRDQSGGRTHWHDVAADMVFVDPVGQVLHGPSRASLYVPGLHVVQPDPGAALQARAHTLVVSQHGATGSAREVREQQDTHEASTRRTPLKTQPDQ